MAVFAMSRVMGQIHEKSGINPNSQLQFVTSP
jgi:hypothetical protein